MAMRDLRKSRVLANAEVLAEEAYRLTARLPRSERFGMSSQIQRAAVSVPANIGEGLGRGNPGDFERSLRIASGSLAELTVLLRIASKIHDVTNSRLDEKVDHVRRQLILLTRHVRKQRST